MHAILWIIGLIVVGWVAIAILPAILPFIGYAIVGLLVLMVIGALLGKR